MSSQVTDGYWFKLKNVWKKKIIVNSNIYFKSSIKLSLIINNKMVIQDSTNFNQR